MASVDEEVLIGRIISARSDLGVSTPAECLEVLEGEFAGLTLSQVKKACSKATKRTGQSGAAAKPELPPEAPAKPSKRQEKEAAKAAKSVQAEVKAAESAMMEAQRKLKVAKTGEADSAVTITGTVEAFVQAITQRAISGVLEYEDQFFLRERIEADIAALEWVKLAQASGALSLKEGVIALGVEVQLARLKEVRGAKDQAAARACYVVDEKPRDVPTPAADANAALDARVKAHAASQQSHGAIDEMD